MDKWYLYCDHDSKEMLESPAPKVLLVGSDFGYGNFGDILQLKGSIKLHDRMGPFTPVAVLAVEAISDPQFISYAKKVYGVSGILFVSQQPLDFSESGLGLEQVRRFRAIELMHLYGGGFLNEKWGGYVLAVTEFLISILKIPYYLISGQQVDAVFAQRSAQHIAAYQPLLVGVRDELSRQNLAGQGVNAAFSFDDAFEELGEITRGFAVDLTGGLLVHLNLSSYTGNENQLSVLSDHLNRLADTKAAAGGLTVINAFSDKRHFVVDTLAAIKELERQFPFADYRVLDGTLLAYRGRPEGGKRIAAALAYSCSYHVTMFMHLLGVPCWLNNNNDYYNQKCLALGIEQDFKQFLDNPMLPDYARKTAARKRWLKDLADCLQGLTPEHREIADVFPDESGPSPNKFAYKNNEIASVHDVEWHQNNATKYWKEASHFKWKLGLAEEELTGLNKVMAERDAQIAGLNQAAVQLNAQIDRLNQTVAESEARLAGILASRSWRMTRPLRLFGKIFRRGS